MQSFSELSLSSPLARAITDLGFEKPSPVQAETLPILLGDKTDFIGLAATGTGKTAAFAIPLIEKLDAKKRAVQAVILCPTRELALQVAGQVDLLGKYKGIQALPIYGGSSYHDQFRGLDRGVAVVVGTPGRLVDHIERGSLRLDEVETIILDEADEMISMGFKEDLEKILGAAAQRDEARDPNNIWLFSATMSPEVRKVAEKFLRQPQSVQINRTEMLPSTVEQLYYPTHEGDKPEILCKLIDAADDFFGIVFCQTKSLVVDLTQYLTDRGYKVDCLHGDKNQAQRERTMQAFRDHKVTILVCTDVAARGLDVKDVTHVINYSLPRELDNYVHRIGRTGRSGKNGVAMSLVTQAHRRLVFQIEKMTKSRMTEGKIPTRRELASKKLARHLPKFQDQPKFERALEVMDESWKEALANMTAEEVAARFLTSLFPEVFADGGLPRMSRSNVPAGDAAGPQGPRRAEGRFEGRPEGRSDRGPRFNRPDRGERPARREWENEESRPVGRPQYDRPFTSDRPVAIARQDGGGRPRPVADGPLKFDVNDRPMPRPQPAPPRKPVGDLRPGEEGLNRRARRELARAEGRLRPIDPLQAAMQNERREGASRHRVEGGNQPPSRSARSLN